MLVSELACVSTVAYVRTLLKSVQIHISSLLFSRLSVSYEPQDGRNIYSILEQK